MLQKKKVTVTTFISLLTALCVTLLLCAVIAIADNTPLGTAFAASTDEVTLGNQLVLNEVYDEETQELKGYSIAKGPVFKVDKHIVLGDTYNGLPLLEIEQGAFSRSQFKSFTLKHGVLNPDLSSDEAFVELDTACNHSVNIADLAFWRMTADYIDILVDVTFDDPTIVGSRYLDFEIGHSTDVFSKSSICSITLPNNITYLPSGMFMDCQNLCEINNADPNVEVNHISDNITAIGSDAFSGCTSLLDLYLPSSITKMGVGVFDVWGITDDLQTLHFDDLYEAPVGEDGYDWDVDWQGRAFENVQCLFKTITVTLDKQGGKDGIGTDYVIVMCNHHMPEATAPEKDGYDFQGYFTKPDGKGDQYYDENMQSVNEWSRNTPTVLYAKWERSKYKVVFDNGECNSGAKYVDAVYGDSMPQAEIPVRIGYYFLGYYHLDEQGRRTYYYDWDMSSLRNWDYEEDGIVLIAEWDAIDYLVSLQEDDFTFFIHYGEELPNAPMPTKDGYVFNGYFDEYGKQIYDKNMKPLGLWMPETHEDSGPYYLFPKWEAIYNVNYELNGGVISEPNPTAISKADNVQLAEPTRSGRRFVGWLCNGILVTDSDQIIDIMIGLGVTEITVEATWSVA